MKKTLISATAVLCTALPASAGTSFIANSFFDGAHPLSKYGYTEWAEMVRELSDGALEPEVFTGTVLLAPRAALQGIRDNVVQVAYHAAVYTPSELPVANAIQELGFNYSDPIVATFAITDFSMHNDAQLAEWDEQGIVYLGGYSTPPYILMCSEPVRNLEELNGKRIRTAGSAVSAWVEAAGGIPVNVPSSEMYTGLERGTLDCATNAASDLVDRSLMEVAEHTTLVPTGMYWSGPNWGVNPDFWVGLQPELRGVLIEASARAMARTVINYTAQADAALETAKDNGGNVYTPEADLAVSIEGFRATTLESVYEKATETYGLGDAKTVIDDFRAKMDKWTALLADVDTTDEDALTALAMSEIYGDINPVSYGVK
ncbi:C4-dicarboxylate ABC transporter substrate-binding protein [Pseudooceanicola lipolyticus]|uniref:C4-dicarboxylate ABC transporter substrate-binding protein n=1 Tax=Pseudooceanicola lipolyticus TaxID=2029104 RepID=A0A2M8J2I9_9RHOB|nr:C4-dicarboxylate TRAP transporter substrate-binding protein [Pseudooceanicola lipolyticus]PJE36968.1 C4-dicarboxylate ABC transporter substrate-binding protein [Pseudooceanicola lipolyticus]